MKTVIIASILLLALISWNSFGEDDTPPTNIKLDSSDSIIVKSELPPAGSDRGTAKQTYEIVAIRNGKETSLVKYSLSAMLVSNVGPLFALYGAVIKDKTVVFVYGYLSNIYVGQARVGPDNTFTDIKKSVIIEGGAALFLPSGIHVTDTGATIEIDTKDLNKLERSFQQDKSGEFVKK